MGTDHVADDVADRAITRVTLARAETRVVILPELGGRIASFVTRGHEWLWTNEQLPFRAPRGGSSYVQTADSGGYDECFPTLGPCKLADGVALPDHGELWSQRCELGVVDAGRALTCSWRTHKLPAHFTRRAFIRDDGALRLDYRVQSEAEVPRPFLWSAYPLFPLTPDTRLVIPEDARMRVYAAHGVDVDDGEHAEGGGEQRWPMLRLRGGRSIDLSRPGFLDPGWAVKLFIDMPTGDASIVQAGATLRCTWDAADIATLGLWLNHRGWSPFADGEPYENLAFEPCIGAPDTVSDALGDWHSAAWLDPGEVRTWSLLWQAQ